MSCARPGCAPERQEIRVSRCSGLHARRAAQLQIREFDIHRGTVIALARGGDLRRVLQARLVLHDGGKRLVLIERAGTSEALDHIAADDDV
jgi:hypothetical protein